MYLALLWEQIEIGNILHLEEKMIVTVRGVIRYTRYAKQNKINCIEMVKEYWLKMGDDYLIQTIALENDACGLNSSWHET